MTWLLGNKLITVTTSGCSNKAMRNGLCDNCWVVCKPGPQSPEHSKTSQSTLRRASSTEVLLTCIIDIIYIIILLLVTNCSKI